MRTPAATARHLIVAAASVTSLIASSNAGADDLDPAVRAAMESITGRRSMAHVTLLSSRHLAGREAGTDGYDLAATYAQAQYKAFGLSGGGKSGSFRQSVRLRHTMLGDDNRLTLEESPAGGGTLETHYRVGEDFVPMVFSNESSGSLPIVFAGYGIVSEEHGWDDYKGLDVRGKAVLVLRHEPREKDAGSPFDGKRSTPHARLLTKARRAQERGAALLLIVTDPEHHDDLDPGNSLARWNRLDRERYEREGRPVPKGRPMVADWYEDFHIAAIHVSGRVAERMLAGAGKGDLGSLQRRIDGDMRPRSFLIPGKRAAFETAFDYDFLESVNVVGKLTGSDPALKEQTVIVCGHLDHVGKNWRGEIHPGADDNASGTSAVLEIARALAELPEGPRRTVLFLNFTAEEKGLLGAYHFVREPTVDLDNVVAVLNLDMIGRNDPDEVNLVGKRRAPEIHRRIVANNAITGIELKYDAGAGAARSDNFPFMTKGVPAMSFFSGTHEDYHQPGDVASKVVPTKLESITRLAFLTAYDLANDPDLTPAEARQTGASNPGGGPVATDRGQPRPATATGGGGAGRAPRDSRPLPGDQP